MVAIKIIELRPIDHNWMIESSDDELYRDYQRRIIQGPIVRPIVVDELGYVIRGKTYVMAARGLGHTFVQGRYVVLTDSQKARIRASYRRKQCTTFQLALIYDVSIQRIEEVLLAPEVINDRH